MRLTSLMSEKQQLLEQVAILKKTNSDLQNEIAAKMQLEGMIIYNFYFKYFLGLFMRTLLLT